MGVYVFGTAGPWVKVGHHAVTPRRPNAYYRIAGRGFEGCKHPPSLDGRLRVQDLELLAWYPSLSLPFERALHSACSERVGEFHPASSLPHILSACDAEGERSTVSEAERKKAIAWGWRKARKAKRKAAAKGKLRR